MKFVSGEELAAKQMTEIATPHVHIHIAIALLLCGCNESLPSQKNQPPIVADPPLIDVDAVAIGARPPVILDARFVGIHERVLANGEWICIEGSVKDAGEAMGAPFVNLVCGDCGKIVHCEGHALRRYRIPVNGNLVVRGRVFGDHLVMESDLVFQSQIDEALSKQNSSE